MEPWVDDIADDLQSMSFNSSTTATDIHRSTSSGSDWTSSSAHFPSTTIFKSHSSTTPSGHPYWDSIRRFPSLSLSDLRFLHRLGAGDIGSVYLAELKPPPPQPSADPPKSAPPSAAEPPKCSPPSAAAPPKCPPPSLAEPPKPPPPTALFAAKVMDRKELVSRNKEGRARTEKEILEMLDHPFLPTLYAAVDSPKWSCLLTEFCPGGDLHILRQRQPCKRFPESAVRFYASEVVVALEYLHMLGIVYRDLKPENVLVRSDGHIMLTDFDLSLRCDDSTSTPAQVIPNQNPINGLPLSRYALDPPKFSSTSCILPNCIVPAVSCFHPKRKRKKKTSHHAGPEFVAEPIDVRSMSFVGTHEYLAPEIVSGEGHGSAVDWWTLGIFIFELFYGVTPFRGMDHEVTLANIVARALEFPKEPAVPASAKDLISQLLSKDPGRRMGSTKGASAVKQHAFFQGVNWALLRCNSPPFVPPKVTRDVFMSDDESCPDTPVEYY